VPFIVLRNGWYTENYTDRLAQYLEAGEIVGAAGHGRISAASRQDYAAAAVAALLQNVDGRRAYELGGPSFDLSNWRRRSRQSPGLPSRTTTCRRRVHQYAQAIGLDQNTAEFVAALDASISRGDLETKSQDLEHLLGRPVISLATVIAETQHHA